MDRDRRRKSGRAKPQIHTQVAAIHANRGIGTAINALKCQGWNSLRAFFTKYPPESPIGRRAVGELFPKNSAACNPRVDDPGSFWTEVSFVTFLCIQYHKRIAHHVRLVTDLETAILTRDFAHASTLHAEHERQFGFTYYSVEIALLLAEYQGGANQHSSTLARLLDSLDDTNLKIRLNFASQRIAPATTVLSYHSRLNGWRNQQLSDPSLQSIVNAVFCWADPGRTSEIGYFSYFLAYERSYSLVDAYVTMIDLLARAHCDHSSDPPIHVVGQLRSLNALLQDDRLSAYLRLVDTNTPLSCDETQLFVNSLADTYTRGDFSGTIAAANHAKLQARICFDVVELIAKASANSLSARTSIAALPAGPAAAALSLMVDAMTPASPSRHSSLDELLKLSYSLSSLRFGQQCLAFCLSCIAIPQGRDSRRTAACLAVAPTPRTSTAASDATAFLDKLEAVRGSSNTIALYRYLVSGKCKGDWNDHHPSIVTHFTALRLEQAGEFDLALKEYSNLRSRADALPTSADAALAGIVRCHQLTSQHTAAAELIELTGKAAADIPPAVNLWSLLDDYWKSEHLQQSPSPAWPLLCWRIYTRQGQLRNAQELHAVLDNFLAARGLTRPSQLAVSAEDANLIVLLADICVPNVLDFSHMYENVDDLEGERIAICQRLLAIDPANESEYTEEFRQLVRRRLIRRGIKYIDANRVRINVPGARRSLDTATLEDIETFVNLAQHHPQILNRLYVEHSALVASEAGGHASISVVPYGISLFRSVFEAVLLRFISSNEYGLDAYLSLRIRHGILLGQIRSCYERARIVARKDNSGQYQADDHWAKAMRGSVDTKEQQQVASILIKLSTQVDETVAEVNATKLRIKVPNGSGLFDYGYTGTQFQSVYAKAVSAKSSSQLLDIVFEELLARTAVNLKRTREYVLTELSPRLSCQLDDAIASIENVNVSLRQTLGREMVQCKTEVTAQMSAIAEWFTLHDDQAIDDYMLGDLLDTAVEIVRTLNPLKPLAYFGTIGSGLKCRGSTFTGLFDVMYILLDNVVRHSSGTPPHVAVSAEVSGNLLRVKVDNEVAADDLRIIEIRDRIAGLNARLLPGASAAQVKQEGGSGLYKLQRILQHDLEFGNHYACVIEVSNDNRFCVTLNMPAAGVLA